MHTAELIVRQTMSQPTKVSRKMEIGINIVLVSEINITSRTSVQQSQWWWWWYINMWFPCYSIGRLSAVLQPTNAYSSLHCPKPCHRPGILSPNPTSSLRLDPRKIFISCGLFSCNLLTQNEQLMHWRQSFIVLSFRCYWNRPHRDSK